jgi:hypothetical protein
LVLASVARNLRELAGDQMKVGLHDDLSPLLGKPRKGGKKQLVSECASLAARAVHA